MATATERKHMSMMREERPIRRKRIKPPFWVKPWVYIGVVLAILVIWLLPTIVGYTSLVEGIVNRSAAELNGRVAVGYASLGWFSPIRLNGVQILDREDQVVVEIPAVQADRSLLAVLWGAAKLGRFRLEGPKLTVVLRDNGSNVEDVFANYLVARERPPRDIAVEIVGGSIAVQEARTQQEWQIDKLALDFAMSADPARPWELKTSGVVADARRPGQFELALRIQQGPRPQGGAAAESAAQGADDAESAGPDEVSFKAENLPLRMFESLARRGAPGTRLSGWLSTALESRWDSKRPGGRATLQGNVIADEFKLSGPMLGRDQPALTRFRAEGSVAWEDGLLEFNRVTSESDVGSLAIHGAIDTTGRGRTGDTPVPAAQRGYEVQGQLDLARLAAILPDTLRIEKDTQITSGKVQLAFSSRPGRDGMVWQGRLETSSLTANNGGRPLVWQQPILVTLSARETAQGPVVDLLKCESSFLNLQASGTPSYLTASATFDASKLADQTRGLVDFGGLRVSGDGWAEADWKRVGQEGFELAAQLRVNDFQWAMPGRPVWKEDNLTLTWSAAGRTHLAGQSRLDASVLKIEAGGDLLQARLREPVVDFLRGRAWPLEVFSRGRLGPWPGRLAPWLGMQGWAASGTYELLGGASVSGQSVEFRQARFTADNLEVRSPELLVREPKAEATVTGRWDWAARRVEIESANLSCPTISLQADRFLCALPSQGPVEITGTVACQAALDRLHGWTVVDAKNDPPSLRLAGSLGGKAEFRQSGGLISARADGLLQGLDIVHRSGQRYQENEARFAVRGDYNDVSRLVHIEQADLTSASLRIAASGRIAQLSSQPDLQLSGRIDYDMERFSRFLRSLLGDVIWLGGQGSSPVSYRGVWGSNEAVAAGALNWTWAQLYGFELGPGELKAALSRGVLDVQPLDVECNKGRLRLAPRITLAPQAKDITLGPGRVVEQVQITPAMCNAMLQYVAPLLAGVTSVQGSLSIDLEGCRLPLVSRPGLVDWSETEIAGKVQVHSAQIGPGMLIQQIAQLLGRTTPAYLMRESVIPFRVTKGRVYHQQMELAFNELTVRTYGSVGFDQSLAMVVEMPIPPAWQQGKLLGSALKDQTLKLPISGTLRQPKLDRTAFDQAARQFFQNAAQGVLQNQVNRQLERLMPPAQKK